MLRLLRVSKEWLEQSDTALLATSERWRGRIYPLTRNRPRPVRAAGKGKGKGPIDGCLICGGAHYQSVCPNGAQSSLRTLCYLKEVKEKVEEEVEEAARGKLKPTRARNFQLYIYI
jgi:hypothetical protein